MSLGLGAHSGPPTEQGFHSPLFSPGLALCPEVQELLEGCELPDLPSSLLLPEDMALRNLPPLRAAHRRFNFDTGRLLLSTLEEVRQSSLTPRALVLKTRQQSRSSGWGWAWGQAGTPSVQTRGVSLAAALSLSGPFGLAVVLGRISSHSVYLCRTSHLPLSPPFGEDRTSKLLGL